MSNNTIRRYLGTFIIPASSLTAALVVVFGSLAS